MLPVILSVEAASEIALFLNINRRIGFTITGILKNIYILNTTSSIAPIITKNTIIIPEKEIITSYSKNGLSGIVFKGLVTAVKIQLEQVIIMNIRIKVRQLSV